MLYFNFHVSLGDKTEKRNDLFCAWKSRVRIPHWYSLSISLLSFFMLFLYHCETTDTADENLDLWLHHLWLTILTHGTRKSPFMAVRNFSVSACLSHLRIKLLSQNVHHCYMSRPMTKPTKWHLRPAKTQIIRPVWSESSLSAWRKLGSLAISYPLNEQRRLWSDWANAQTYLSLGWGHSHFIDFVMRRLIYKSSGTTSTICSWAATAFRNKNNVLRFKEHLLYFFFFFFAIKATEFE